MTDIQHGAFIKRVRFSLPDSYDDVDALEAKETELDKELFTLHTCIDNDDVLESRQSEDVKHIQQLMNIDVTKLDGVIDDWDTVNSGGYGTVYETTLSVENGNRVPVAIKYIPLNTPLMECSFRREMLSLSELPPHPNIPKIYGCYTDVNGGYIVLERFKQDLHGASNGILKRSLKYATIFRDVAKALIHMEQNDYKHRDCKLGNILLDRDGRAVLVDFGKDRFFDKQVTNTADIAANRANEMRSAKYDDVLALGKTIGAARKCLTDSQYVHDGRWMELVSDFCTQKDRYARPSMKQVHMLLERIADQNDQTDLLFREALEVDIAKNKEADIQERKKRIQEKETERDRLQKNSCKRITY